MKVLVYGAGVIGSQIIHALMISGNDVTVIARGKWKETLQKDGLRIRHYIQRIDTVDHPRILEKPDDEYYDIAFAVMQYKQMEAVLDDLSAINTKILMLVGNNLSVDEMEQKIPAASEDGKSVLFGFGSTAGIRENGRVITVHTGDGELTAGKAHEEMSANEKALIHHLFAGSKMNVSFTDSMDAWLKYHAAFILPVVYLCYKNGCDLKHSSSKDRKLVLDAAHDAYKLLMSLGIPVRPEGDERYLEPGLLNRLMRAVIWLICNTRIGALCTSEHCAHAPQEMEDLDKAFRKIRALNPDFAMPHFDGLSQSMPPWEEIHRTYGK